MNTAQLTLITVLLISAALSSLYAFWLEQIHDVYSPNLLWLVVAIGNGAIIDTVLILDRQLGILPTGLIVFFVNVAWGAPIIAWQLWQAQQRRITLRSDHENEGCAPSP